MKIAIHFNEKIFSHSTMWNNEWENYCKENNIFYEIVNCYELDIIDKLKGFDCLLWHFENYSLQDMLFARSILYSAKQMGLKVFPNIESAWHFDDKIAEYFLLKSVDAPTPQSWIFFTKDDCIKWLNETALFPMVAKLKSGSGSNNVKLIKSEAQGRRYAHRMFNKGYRNVPSLLFKAKSNIKTATNIEVFKRRFKRIPEFIKTRANASKLPRERGYVYFQEFIPNEGYDLKIVVIGDKLCFVSRNVRKNDFRASGGGELNYNKSLVTQDIISSAFEISDKLNFQCMGFDYVVNNQTNKPYIVEFSYGFSHLAQLDAGGYFDRQGVWHNEPFNAPAEMIKNMIKNDK